jgi:resuscitation-promoting factor RpfA
MRYLELIAARIVVASSVAFGIILGVSSAAHASSGWNGVAACESGGNWSTNTGNGYYGGLQFSHSTWISYGGGAYAPNANGASSSAQIAIAQRVLAAQGPGAWPVCGRSAGLTRSSGGGSGYAARAAAPVVPRSAPLLSRTTVRQPTVDADGLGTLPAVRQQLVVDGIVGPLTTGATQRWLGVSQDGLWGARTTAALQHKVGASVSGIQNAATIHRLQVFLRISPDGASHLNYRTSVALQRYLNG